VPRVSLKRVDGEPGPPWARPLRGVLHEVLVESDLLADNPLGDPSRRPLYVYSPPGELGRLPAIYVLQGYSGQLDVWRARKAFEPTVIERLDAMFAAGESTPALIVFLDAWTSRGGSQFINSSANGRYMDYICDEIVPFVDEAYATLASPGARAVIGGSSGGYGAMVLAMLRPDVFGALASIAGDGLFECSYLRGFPAVARKLRDAFDGSYEVFFAELARADGFDWERFGAALETYAYAAAYSPDPDRPGQALLPFELATGRLLPDVWERWLEHDPVRMAPGHADALLSLRAVHLYAGRSDEYFLDLAAQAFSAELEQLGVEHTLDLYPGTHGSIRYQYPRAVAVLARALAR
jgi:S-formylglutathione hydrolase FrmB